MEHESYTFTRPYPEGPVKYVSYDYAQSWERSPRVNGKLVLQPNPWSLSVTSATCTNSHLGGPSPLVYVDFQATTNDPIIQRARAIALSDLRGALARRVKNKNAGALGVSIATSAQSISMMKGSAKSLTSIFSAAERFYQTSRGKQRLKRFRRLISRGAEPTAGMVLAGFFGWAPLFEDFSSAARTLADPWPPASWMSSKKPWFIGPQHSFVQDGPFYSHASTWSATGHCTYSCAVHVSNPNLWVANKLGLINLPGIAWDLVPWSFLVNMVSNMGQVMGSLTDFAGLSLTGTSLTDGLHLVESSRSVYKDPRPNAISTASGTRNMKVRSRVVGVPPPSVTPYLRFPEWGVGTAAIVGSLLIQQTGRLTRAISR